VMPWSYNIPAAEGAAMLALARAKMLAIMVNFMLKVVVGLVIYDQKDV
jgi:hypothetical protein